MSLVDKCLICYPERPTVWGGTEQLVSSLAEQLKRRGLRVETLSLPSVAETKIEVLDEALQWATLDLGDDHLDALVITTKFPSYLLHHPRKRVWLIHQYREIYDLHGHHLSSFKNEVLDHDIREMLMRLDLKGLSEAQRLYCISANVARRLKNDLGLAGRVLYPPSPLTDRLHREPPGDYVLAVSRLDANKRIDLLLEALVHSNELKARIAGEGPLRGELEAMAERLGVLERVTFLGRVSDEALVDLYAQARVVFVGPIDEDYGLVTIEAMGAGRPVVATSDSGGPLEFVEHDVNGFVVEPSPVELAEALFRVQSDDELARQLGQEGWGRVQDLSWDNVVEELVS